MSKFVGRLLHTTTAVLRRDTEFVVQRRKWRQEISEFRKSVQYLQDEIGGRVDKRGRRRDRKKFRHLRQATEAANTQPIDPVKEQEAKKKQDFYFAMKKVQRELKDFKIEQGMEQYKVEQQKEMEAAKEAVQKKMNERNSFLLFENEQELEQLLSERVEEEVQYDFFIDGGRSHQSQRIANILGDFGSVFERSKVDDTTPKKQPSQ